MAQFSTIMTWSQGLLSVWPMNINGIYTFLISQNMNNGVVSVCVCVCVCVGGGGGGGGGGCRNDNIENTTQDTLNVYWPLLQVNW